MSSHRKTMPIPVSLMGMNERMTNSLEYLFSHAGENDCKIVVSQKAEIIILDIDSTEGKKIYQDEKSLFQNKRLVVLSVKELHDKNAVHVQKPVKSSELLSAINTIYKESSRQDPEKERLSTESDLLASNRDKPEELRPEATSANSKLSMRNREAKADINLAKIGEKQEKTHLASQTKTQQGNLLRLVKTSPAGGATEKSLATTREWLVGSAPDIDPDNSEQRKSREYNRYEYFQGYFNNIVMVAKRQNQPIRINMPKGSMVVLPGANTVLIDMTESDLQAFSSFPLSREKVTVFFLDKKELESFSQRAISASVHSLLWKLAIWASLGRFPVGTSLHMPVRFQNWSEISSQVLSFKHTEQIASLWNQKSVSLLETAKELNIPQRYVFTFYSACHAIGIASVIDKSQNKRRHDNKEPKKKSFMNKVAKRLRVS